MFSTHSDNSLLQTALLDFILKQYSMSKAVDFKHTQQLNNT